jgi:hypothetical protein
MADDPNQEVPGTGQFPWEIALEDALAAATPKQVVVILRRIKGWLVGYCETCGAYTDPLKNNKCSCPNKGFWDKSPKLAVCKDCGFSHPGGTCMDS